MHGTQRPRSDRMRTLWIWIYGYARYWGRPLERGDLGLDLQKSWNCKMHPFLRFESMGGRIVARCLLRHEKDPSIGTQALASASIAVRGEQIDTQAMLK